MLEATDRLGGKVQSTPFAGLPSVECGADMFLARTPAAIDLAGDAGAGRRPGAAPSPRRPSSGRAAGSTRCPRGWCWAHPLRWTDGAIPTCCRGKGKARAAARAARAADRHRRRASGATIRHRFGDEVLERLVGPLIGGINAGDPDRLSLRGVTPQLAEALAAHRSLLLGLRAQARSARRAQATTTSGGPPRSSWLPEPG